MDKQRLIGRITLICTAVSVCAGSVWVEGTFLRQLSASPAGKQDVLCGSKENPEEKFFKEEITIEKNNIENETAEEKTEKEKTAKEKTVKEKAAEEKVAEDHSSEGIRTEGIRTEGIRTEEISIEEINFEEINIADTEIRSDEINSDYGNSEELFLEEQSTADNPPGRSAELSGSSPETSAVSSESADSLPGDPGSSGTPGTTLENPGTASENPGTASENPDTASENSGTTSENPDTISENPDTASENSGTSSEAPADPSEAPVDPSKAPEDPSLCQPKELHLIWDERKEFIWDGLPHYPLFLALDEQGREVETEFLVTVTIAGENAADAETEDMPFPETLDYQKITECGTYRLTVSLNPEEQDQYTITEETTEFTILQRPIQIQWDLSAFPYVYNGNEQQLPSAWYEDVSGNRIPVGDIVEADGRPVIGAGQYTAAAHIDDPHYTADQQELTCPFSVEKLAVRLKAKPAQKYYGEKDPAFDFDVTAGDETVSQNEAVNEEIVRQELLSEFAGPYFTREDLPEDEKENAGITRIVPAEIPALNNYRIVSQEGSDFEIIPLPVKVIPVEGQSKIYGEPDPEFYSYKVEFTAETASGITSEMAAEEMGEHLLGREQGEDVQRDETGAKEKQYAYSLSYAPQNYQTELEADAAFVIRPVDISVRDFAISSRSEGFTIFTNLEHPEALSETDLRIVIEAEFPEDTRGIFFSDFLDDYISGAEKGIPLTDSQMEIPVKEMQYRYIGAEQVIAWSGRLPAGTILSVSAEGQGGIVSAEPVWLKVERTPASLAFGSPAGDVLGKNDFLYLSGTPGEYVEVDYGGAAYYQNADVLIQPAAAGEGQLQTIWASFLDVLNLSYEPASFSFVYDDQALPVPDTGIIFSNRDSFITVTLPESGRITEAVIAGGTVTLDEEEGLVHVLPVVWSGNELNPEGAAIQITYTDRKGNEGTGEGRASRAKIDTPVYMSLFPEPNREGYLNGSLRTLIVSGSACAGEQIRVTCAGVSVLTRVNPPDTWSDQPGSWEVLFSAEDLPEGDDFQITAEYVDVDGQGAARNVRYDASCRAPALFSPVFESMHFICGAAEPGTSVTLVINGQKTYPVYIDRHGRFFLDKLPMLLGGIDFFDLYVTDAAGNTAFLHREIPEAGDSRKVKGTLSPVGKIFYRADENSGRCYLASPVDLPETAGESRKIPLLFGMGYEMGTLEIKAEGETITPVWTLSEKLKKGEYKTGKESLMYWTRQPSFYDLEQKTGQSAAFGEKIRIIPGSRIWICCEIDIEMTEEAMEEMMQEKLLYDFEQSLFYEECQRM